MKKIALLAGGNSGEHEISIQTAQNIYNLLDKSKFDVYFIVVKGKEWYYLNEKNEKFVIDKNDFSLPLPEGKLLFDAAFIAIHGTPGENGLLQGYLEMMEIPYTGCDCFCSALTFNKYFCNVVAASLDIPISKSLHYYKSDPIDLQEIIDTCGLPCFVKPCNSGSSIGVTKAHDAQELQDAIATAFQVDDQIMIEKFIPGRELTCGVAMINGKPKALAITEILSKKEFYDFEAKYTEGFLEKVTPAQIDKKVEELIMRYSEKLYQGFGCKGVVRFDYIATEEGQPLLLEINTIPGQTAMSLIPKQVQMNNIELNDFYAGLIYEILEK